MFPCESSFPWINCSTWTRASIFFGQNSVLSLQNNRSRGLSMICFISFDPAADTSQATPYNVVLWVEKFIQRLAPSCYLIWPLKTFNLEYQIPKPRNKVTTRWEGPQSLSYHKQWLSKMGYCIFKLVQANSHTQQEYELIVLFRNWDTISRFGTSITSGRSMDWERKNVSRWIFFEIGRW